MSKRASLISSACFLLLVPLSAAPARRSPAFDGTIVNHTLHDLVRTESSLSSGKWCGEPPALIKAGQTASFCAEGPAGNGGTQGFATYRIGETETTVVVNFAVDEGQISHSQSAAFSSGAFRATLAGTDDCARNWRGAPHCFCDYTFTIAENR